VEVKSATDLESFARLLDSISLLLDQVVVMGRIASIEERRGRWQDLDSFDHVIFQASASDSKSWSPVCQYQTAFQMKRANELPL